MKKTKKPLYYCLDNDGIKIKIVSRKDFDSLSDVGCRTIIGTSRRTKEIEIEYSEYRRKLGKLFIK